MGVYFGVRLPACLLAAVGCLVATAARPQMLPSDIFLSRAAAERAQGGLLSGPMRALRVATLEWPEPLAGGVLDPATPQPQAQTQIAALASPAVTSFGDATYAYPPPLVLGGALPASDPAGLLSDREDVDTPTVFGPSPNADAAYLELALDLVLSLPGLDEESMAADDQGPPTFGPDMSELDVAEDPPQALIFGEPPPPGATLDSAELEAPYSAGLSLDASEGAAQGIQASRDMPIVHDMRVVFGLSGALFPPLAFEYAALPPSAAPLPPMPPVPPGDEETDGIAAGDRSPAERLSLDGPARARAEKCLAEAIYFESRGEPKRGQIAVAQVVMNRVFSGYYPNDVCKTVYQNAHRHLACQFTFACDDVKDVIREPDMWVQAKQIASDMLDGKLWLSSVGRATHYHAYWVRPSWVREMRKLDRIGVHTFYRPRRWDG
ncbi:cell wall hydrolase [Xanthobacter sp. DSM 24535]|uniref:cell wall hydrolase n=1 Tax=Roseixanthobacter psychrophilus TaxID=3119917 RepID=UPI0037299EBA